MTPKPDNLPDDPAEMTLAQVLQEAARILHNMGGAEWGAGYSAKLADAALRHAENLPGWKPIETAPRDGVIYLTDGATIAPGIIYIDRWTFWEGDTVDDWRGDAAGFLNIWIGDNGPTHWYDFGHGSPMPPTPEGGE